MIFVHADGSYDDLPGVTRCRVDGNRLLCFNTHDKIIRQYNPRAVLVYGKHIDNLLHLIDALTQNGDHAGIESGLPASLAVPSVLQLG